MILRITKADIRGPFKLALEFNDGTQKTVDVRPLLKGPVFTSLLDPKQFEKVLVDPICGTVVWPNGADLAPEALYELAPLGQLSTV